jgi:hypothetical protein
MNTLIIILVIFFIIMLLINNKLSNSCSTSCSTLSSNSKFLFSESQKEYNNVKIFTNINGKKYYLVYAIIYGPGLAIPPSTTTNPEYEKLEYTIYDGVPPTGTVLPPGTMNKLMIWDSQKSIPNNVYNEWNINFLNKTSMTIRTSKKLIYIPTNPPGTPSTPTSPPATGNLFISACRGGSNFYALSDYGSFFISRPYYEIQSNTPIIIYDNCWTDETKATPSPIFLGKPYVRGNFMTGIYPPEAVGGNSAPGVSGGFENLYVAGKPLNFSYDSSPDDNFAPVTSYKETSIYDPKSSNIWYFE